MLQFRGTSKLGLYSASGKWNIFGVKQYNVFHCYVVLSAKNEEMRIPRTVPILL